MSPLLDVKQVDRTDPDARFSPDNATLVVVDNDRRAHVFDLQTGKHRTAPISLAGPQPNDREVNAPAKFSADGSRCFFMNSAGTVYRYDARTWKKIGDPVQHPHREGYSFGFDVSVDGKWLATFDGPGESGPKGVLQVWEAETGDERLALTGHSGVVWSVAFTPDGSRLASAGEVSERAAALSDNANAWIAASRMRGFR